MNKAIVPGGGAAALDGLPASQYLRAESGQWTPILRGTATAGSPEYNRRGGGYIKIGSLVFISVDIYLRANGGMTGALRIDGLPFAATRGMMLPVAQMADVANCYGYIGAGATGGSNTGLLFKTIGTGANYNAALAPDNFGFVMTGFWYFAERG